MRNDTITRRGFLGLTAAAGASSLLSGCGGTASDGKRHVEVVTYKQEAVKIFERLQDEFNATHDDIAVSITCPNNATTVMRTRFIREDYPDIIGIGGDISFSNFIDAGILADVSDFEGLGHVKPAYLDILETLEFVPTEGTFGVPYMANAAGVLYNRQMFREHGWDIPTTWQEFIDLCETIRAAGILPLYFGFKDTWTTLAPWNALAIELAPSDICQQVNAGRTTFTEHYRETAEKIQALLAYGEDGPFAYGYNDACTAFARGESAMYTIGSYAVPQILSVNPEMDIDSFVMPGNDSSDGQVLNSGVDLQFCVMEACPDKEAAYEVLSFLLEHDNMQTYVDDQNAVPCTTDDFDLPDMLDGMRDYIEEGRMADFQDHHYPSEMDVAGQIQTFLIEGDVDAFLAKFDADWTRYNRDIIQKVQDYYATQA
ncbi:MAG: substrate-binding domain-containing protein [Acidobacteriota bacterium]|nr:substrate-binding domain-containing protein [Acidobacteriota bacterium]